jgi:hypothetical protein
MITMIDTSVVKTAAGNGTTIDISGVTGDATVFFRCESFTAGKNAVFSVQDSADTFVSDIVTRGTFEVSGAVLLTADLTLDLRKYLSPSTRFGVTSARLRVSLTYVDTGASIQYSTWMVN